MDTSSPPPLPQTVTAARQNAASRTLGIIAIAVGVLSLAVGRIPLFGLFDIPTAIIGLLVAGVGYLEGRLQGRKGADILVLGGIICAAAFVLQLLYPASLPPRMIMVLRCAKCHVTLSQEVVELRDPSLLSVKAREEYVPVGLFRVCASDDPVVHCRGEFILNLGDLTNTKRHPDARRTSGCCGSDGLNGMNIVCVNGHEIGTECSDCWMPHYAHIPRSAVEVLEPPLRPSAQ